MKTFAQTLAVGAMAAVTLLSSASAADAATYYKNLQLSPPGSGKYRLDVSFAQPTSGWWEIGGEYRYNVFDKATGAYSWGNEEPYWGANGELVAGRSISVQIKTPKSGVYDHGSEIEYYSHSRWFSMTANSDQPIEYSYTFTAVPEPATWAMMIIGFAGVGGALRGKRKSIATA